MNRTARGLLLILSLVSAKWCVGEGYPSEEPYAFRERLKTVHRAGLRNAALKPANFMVAGGYEPLKQSYRSRGALAGA